MNEMKSDTFAHNQSTHIHTQQIKTNTLLQTNQSQTLSILYQTHGAHTDTIDDSRFFVSDPPKNTMKRLLDKSVWNYLIQSKNNQNERPKDCIKYGNFYFGSTKQTLENIICV
jgi:hypothetical protein